MLCSVSWINSNVVGILDRNESWIKDLASRPTEYVRAVDNLQLEKGIIGQDDIREFAKKEIDGILSSIVCPVQSI